MSFEWRAIVVAVMIAALLLGAVAAYAIGHSSPSVCVSSVGPVDESGRGNATAEAQCR